MCGRYVNVASTEDLVDQFDVDEAVGDDLPPSWNVAPTDDVRIVAERHPVDDRRAAPVRQLRTVRWGLVPHWSRSSTTGAKMINARSETVSSKPAFKAAAARRRCLVPALGYYEWMRADGAKVPYFLHDPERRTIAMAGLYEIWRDGSLPEDDPQRWLWTATIITRPATDALGHVHDRCPVIVPLAMHEAWLDCTAGDPEVAQRLLANMAEPRLDLYPVGRAVGNVRNNSGELIEPVTDPAGGTAPLDLDVVTDRRTAR